MPPTFAYIMCLMLYLAAMAIGLFVCAFLSLVRSKRRLAHRLCFAILASLPGVLVFQLVVAVPLVCFVGVVLGVYSLFHPPDWVQGLIGIPTVLIVFLSVATASLVGCYTGGRVGWQAAGGESLRSAITNQKAIGLLMSKTKRF